MLVSHCHCNVISGMFKKTAAYELSLAEGLRFERRIFHGLFATKDQKEGEISDCAGIALRLIIPHQECRHLQKNELPNLHICKMFLVALVYTAPLCPNIDSRPVSSEN